MKKTKFKYKQLMCNTCDKVKNVSEFPLSKRNTNLGVQGTCKACKAAWMRQDRVDNPRKYRDMDIKKLYGIDTGIYEKLLKIQLGECAICGGQSVRSHKRLNIDHCHKTKKVRGLLCENCNLGIGNLQEDISILESAIRYLKGGE